MKKKRAIRNYVLISIFIVLVMVLSFISFPVPGTYYDFKGFANLNLGLELGGGVKNTYELEVADWYDGTKEDAYKEAVDRMQYLLDKTYADAKVYLNGEDKVTIEVPDTTISTNFTVGFIEMKLESGEDKPVRVSGEDIESVEYMLNGTTHGVYIKFTEKGKEKYKNLTREVSESTNKTMYIYMDKDYENPFSQPQVTEENSLGYTFISGDGITNKASGMAYANKLESALIGVNMSTDLDEIEISGRYGEGVKIAIYVATAVIVIATAVIAYVAFKNLGLVSMLSVLFALAVSVLISAFADMQITIGGWLGFMFGYILNFSLHMFYLNVIKKQYAMGKKFTVSFSAGYKDALFNILDTLLILTGATLLLLVVPSNLVRSFVFNYLVTLASTAFTSMYLNKVLAVNYTAFNFKNEKKVNFVREEGVNEIE